MEELIDKAYYLWVPVAFRALSEGTSIGEFVAPTAEAVISQFLSDWLTNKGLDQIFGKGN